MAVVLATVVALISGHLDWRGVLAATAMGVASWGLYRRGLPVAARVAFGISVVALAAGLALHLIPGFNNPKVISDAVLTPDAVPYSKYLNFDKALIGLFLLAFGQQLIGSRRDWALMLRRALPVTAGTVGVVLVLSFVLGYVRFEPAVPTYFWLWAWTNLFFTCMAEEAIFRGLIQQGLERGLERFRLGPVIALVVASVLFGLAHWAGGPKYILLSTVAGFGYGMAMQRSGRIEGSILTHFALNSLHYLLFTYPALASAVG
jgi:membrane protease YdiL (CAAX protease family)